MNSSRETIRSRIPTRAKQLGKQLLCHPKIGQTLARALRDRIPYNGLRIDTSSPRISARTKASIFWGSYEGAESRMVRRYLRSDLDVVELGGSLGVLSCLIRRRLSSSAKLFVVEADPELVQIAERNLAINSTEVYHVIHAAIAGDEQAGHIGVARGPQTDQGRVEDEDPDFMVPAVSLGHLLARFSIADYALVADIEGAESALIMRDRDSLESCRQIIIELHDSVLEDRVLSPEMLLAELVESGFELRAAEGRVCYLER